MTPDLLKFLCDPISRKPLSLVDAEYDQVGNIISGKLMNQDGKAYPIINGIPRFVSETELKKTVESFGDEWNHFNFVDFKACWLNHTVANTFGSTEVFRDKIVVDAGGGSGAQTLWMLESGARHVIMMDLSHSVDDVVQQNLKTSNFTNFDVIQCSIDMPPIREQSIPGIVICHNVIQHTPSVEKTAKALYSLVSPGGEFVFNCYVLNDQGLIRWIRFHMFYKPLRAFLSRLPFKGILFYSRIMGFLRLLPVMGRLSEKVGFCVQGDVPRVKGETFLQRLKKRFRATVLNTFDYFGSHAYQHHKTDLEIRELVNSLQPDATKVLNTDKYFMQPPPIGCALRIYR